MLKSLEVFGFKSFADRTVFAFAPGTTCVVGPNGSGKSNVVDAMKWLLGDQSPKSLRGKNMSDVIFNGSRSRKPSGFAEASLTFDNSQRILSIELDEVRITRRLYQGGDSEYLINNQVSRLKDIRELFMGTGAATSAYSIIEQGRVGQVLQGNPSTRRILFDEAAGISRFKVRRVDAERKLERVSQNLLRLTDIVDEVENQLNACRNQAGKATKYRELSRSYDALMLGMAADDTFHLRRRLRELNKKKQSAHDQLQNFRDQLTALDTEREQLRRAFSVADEELQGIEAKLSTLMQQRSSLLTSLHYQQDRTRELDQEIETLRQQRVELKQRVHDIDREISGVDQQCRQARQAVIDKQQEQRSDEQLLHNIQDQLETIQQDQRDLQLELEQSTRQQAAAENQLTHLQTRDQKLQEGIVRKQQEQQQLREKMAESNIGLDQARQVYEAALTRNTAHRQQIEQIASRRAEIRVQVEGIQARLTADREQRSAWEARLGMLEDMERRQLGLSIGVQEILQRAQRSKSAPWKHVLGILPDFLECDLEHAPLIEIAIGGGGHLVVVDQLQPFLEYLDQGETQFEGRVGFLEVPRGKPLAESVQSTAATEFFQHLQHLPEVITRLDHWVHAEAIYQPLFEKLLSGTWVVDRLTTARKLSVIAPVPLRFLTMQGDLLDASGMVQTGTLLPEGSVVSRRSEIRRIRNELTQLERHIQRLTKKLTEFESIIGRLDHDLDSAKQWMEQQSAEQTQLREKLTANQAAHQLFEREYQRNLDEQDQFETQRLDNQKQILASKEKQEQIQLQISQLREQQTHIEQNQQHTQQKRQEILQGRSHFQLELTKAEERLSATQAVLQRLKKDRPLRESQYEEAIIRLETAIRKRNRFELQILNGRAQVAELYLIGEQLQWDTRQARQKRTQTQIQRDRLNEQLKHLTQARQEQETFLQDVRIEYRDLENELQLLADRVAEEYRCDLQDLIRAQVSALPAYRAMRQGEPIPELDLDFLHAVVEEPTDHFIAAADLADTKLADDQLPGIEADSNVSVMPNDADAKELADDDPAGSRDSVWEDSDFDYAQARPQIENEVQRLRKKIKALGAVDPDSLKGLDELEFRFKHLSTQLHDLKHAQATLEDIIRKINTESRRIFIESFQTIREHFRILFRQLFGGGEGDVLMEDESDPLECGIEIIARPPGKELRSISLLSGGEKTMAAVGLLLAIFKSRPSPFCILDEVDAALDEANIDRFASVIGQFQDKTQFIVITHRKRTMTAADRIFGVTMEEAGVSKRLTVRFEDVGENGEIRTSGSAAA